MKRFIPPAEHNRWVGTVFAIFSIEVLAVSILCLVCTLDQNVRNWIQDLEGPSAWVPILLAMFITWILIVWLGERHPANIYVQMIYLAVWGAAVAAVSAKNYPGFGVLITPGILILGVAVAVLAAYARLTAYRFDYMNAFAFVAVGSTIAFQVMCWNNDDQFDGYSGALWVPFSLCNLYLVLVEAYLIWKTRQQETETDNGDVWRVTATLLQESFGMPLLMPLPIVGKLIWVCWNRYDKKRQAPPPKELEPHVLPYTKDYTWSQLAYPGAETQPWGDWLLGKEPEKTPAELHDERYVGYVMCMDLVLRELQRGDINADEALKRLNYYRDRIIQMDEVDMERARVMLDKEGLTDDVRKQMLAEYQHLRKIGGYEVSPHDLGGVSKPAR